MHVISKPTKTAVKGEVISKPTKTAVKHVISKPTKTAVNGEVISKPTKTAVKGEVISKPTKTAVNGEDHIRTTSAVNGRGGVGGGGVTSEQKLHRIRLEAASILIFLTILSLKT